MWPCYWFFSSRSGALVMDAVVYDPKAGACAATTHRSHDISTAARLARTNADAHGVSGLGEGTNVGGVGGGGAAPAPDDPHVSRARARLRFSS